MTIIPGRSGVMHVFTFATPSTVMWQEEQLPMAQ
jgi:hypothetical protein